MNRDMDRALRLKRDGALHPNPEKVQAELVAQSPFFDARDLVQMKYEMLRSVDVEKQSAAAAARLFGLSRVAYYRAREQYRAEGLPGLLPHKRGPKTPHKFRAEVRGFIDEQLTATAEPVNWRLLSKQIETRFGLRVHPRSVERAARRKKGARNEHAAPTHALRSDDRKRRVRKLARQRLGRTEPRSHAGLVLAGGHERLAPGDVGSVQHAGCQGASPTCRRR